MIGGKIPVKKVMLVLLAILLSLSIACSEEMLRVSIIPEVEAYIDELSLAQGRKCSTDALQNCIRELESMGGKTASAMRLYCTVLVALDDGDFDTAKSAMSLLVLPNVWGLRGLEVCQPLADVLTLALAVWMMTKVIRTQKAQMAQETA